MSTRFFVALAGLMAMPLLAQLAAPTGSRGVAMGHLHLIVRDVDAQRKFWVALGGTPVKNGTLELIEFPGVYIMLRQGEPTGGSVGSVVNHVGFNARNSAESVAKWQAAGLKPEPGNAPGQFYLNTADGLRIEILEDKTISTPLKFHHVHFNFTPDQVTEVQAWYARIFDARPGTRGRYKSGDIGGANLTYGEPRRRRLPLKDGRWTTSASKSPTWINSRRSCRRRESISICPRTPRRMGPPRLRFSQTPGNVH